MSPGDVVPEIPAELLAEARAELTTPSGKRAVTWGAFG